MPANRGIPAQAVEAAAEALYENKYEYRAWDEAKSPESWRDSARAALEAAAPHLLENAWNEGAYSEHDFDGTPTGINPYTASTTEIDEME